MKKVTSAIVALIVIVIMAYCLPLIPDSLPDGMWTEEAFERNKPRIVEAAEKLNALTDKAMKEGYELSYTYNLECDFGHNNVKRAILGSNSFGTSRTATWAFGTWIPAGLPYLEYSDEGKAARLREQDCEDFLAWLSNVDSYPEEVLPKKQRSNKSQHPTVSS